ncbi:3-oxoadipate enol-lactonase [Polynucleobacter sp. AM-26B4]|uniref:3-oxoadipate enol-lactonase n=1 Tax=Polynucleobacter sp. AM-26B4 TaxID=2689103 RepID=UPI001C0BCB59|nr:3-oxoadipate enol-lactonase [Polynucleobacter sp. AM-26B4]MBU3585911.1 3-oxoadipate enol-lactonase [Polynucleobacter sp. AM-26B4]
MSVFTKDGISTFYELSGSSKRRPLILSNSLGTSHRMWDLQISELSEHFDVIRYDTLGHGLSSGPKGPYTIDQLSQQVIDLLNQLNIDKVNFCGLSMGGVIGQWLAIHHPQRIDHLVLANTAPKIGTKTAWLERAALVRSVGMDPIADSAPSRWFTPDFCKAQSEQLKDLVENLRLSDSEGYAACCEALSKADLLQSIDKIKSSTLIIAGTEDPVTTVSDGIYMSKMIPNSTLVQIKASHISNVENPKEFTAALLNFLV